MLPKFRAPHFVSRGCRSFNGHPPLGVNATQHTQEVQMLDFYKFQWAPTLGGECYIGRKSGAASSIKRLFQWAPTLGGECYMPRNTHPTRGVKARQFQWAPTLGGECYRWSMRGRCCSTVTPFQWAPTLGGECYGIVYLITPPLCQGVDALLNISPRF